MNTVDTRGTRKVMYKKGTSDTTKKRIRDEFDRTVKPALDAKGVKSKQERINPNDYEWKHVGGTMQKPNMIGKKKPNTIETKKKKSEPIYVSRPAPKTERQRQADAEAKKRRIQQERADINLRPGISLRDAKNVKANKQADLQEKQAKRAVEQRSVRQRSVQQNRAEAASPTGTNYVNERRITAENERRSTVKRNFQQSRVEAAAPTGRPRESKQDEVRRLIADTINESQPQVQTRNYTTSNQNKKKKGSSKKSAKLITSSSSATGMLSGKVKGVKKGEKAYTKAPSKKKKKKKG